jgi:hypothetical protein
MSKKLTAAIATFIASYSLVANAHNAPKVTLEGSIDTQAGYRDQKDSFDVNSN